ncbi:hypothetical protein CRENBAI_012287 [Crenichthys baileyi]|uniref:Uncharacterized protein n=1 Tax=Crenichthys baileyi TaxID=28760 RepID=A0AAV9RRK2_9TELE
MMSLHTDRKWIGWSTEFAAATLRGPTFYEELLNAADGAYAAAGSSTWNISEIEHSDSLNLSIHHPFSFLPLCEWPGLQVSGLVISALVLQDASAPPPPC